MFSEQTNDVCQASNTEEPGAVIPHAGICAGADGQLAVLPRSRHFHAGNAELLNSVALNYEVDHNPHPTRKAFQGSHFK